MHTAVFLLVISLAACQDVIFYLGRNPYEWENTKRIAYDYKGFFDPVVDAAINDALTTWTWESSAVAPVVKSLNASKTSLTRSIQTGPVLADINTFKNSLYGIIGISTSGEGFFGAEIADVTYFHTYNDGTNAIMDYDSVTKSSIFKSSIRLGPTYSFIANGVLEVLNWIDTESTTISGTNIVVFYENSFSSDKIAKKLVSSIQSQRPSWTVDERDFNSNEFDCAGSDVNYFFPLKYTDMSFFNTTSSTIITQTRGIVIIGSNGFIRQVAVSLHNAVSATDWLQTEDFLLLAIPSTLGPLPSYRASDVLSLNPSTVSATDNDAAKAAFRNLVVLTEDYDQTRYEEIGTIVKNSFYSSRPDLAETGWDPRRPVPLWSGYTYDATLLLMKALQSVSDPSDYYAYLTNKAWTSAELGGIKPFFGTIDINQYGDRNWKLKAYHFNSHYTATHVATITEGSITEVAKPDWPKSIPQLSPKCEYKKCVEFVKVAGTPILITLVVFLCLAILVIWGWFVRRELRFRKALKNLEWNINYEKLEEVALTAEEEEEKNQKCTMKKRFDSLASLNLPPCSHMMYGEMQVYLKPLLREFFEDVLHDKRLMEELQQLKDIKSEFLVDYIGLTKDKTGFTWMVYEDCIKGTLQQTLEDESFEIDAQFKLSMIDDIAQGMQFIHNNTRFRSHGNLKPSNVLVTRNFTLKVSDFGDSIFMNDMKRNYNHSETQHNKRLLWRAPELLRKSHIRICGTQPGDLYSFAIIVHDIVTRQGPFNLNSLENTENPTSIIQKVKDTTTEPFRPKFRESVRNKYIKRIVRWCDDKWWHEDPAKRTNFKTICAYMRKLRPSKKQKTFLDTAIRRIEKFNHSLEKKKEEKREQAEAEMKKVTELRASLIPKDIIKAGVDDFVPETIPNVTVVVVELDGLDKALVDNPKLLKEVVNVESAFRSTVDNIAYTSGIHYGISHRIHRVWFISQTRKDGPNNHSCVMMVLQNVMNRAIEIIEKSPLRDILAFKAGIHNGTINTGMIGDSSDPSAQFIFCGVVDVANALCSSAQEYEVLATEDARKVFNDIKEMTLCLDWGEKNEYESGKKIEAYSVDVLGDCDNYCLIKK